jgi:8-oxo-dGTP diphosphatase
MPNFEKFMISQVAVWVKDSKVLILEDSGNPGLWVLPGGRIDEQEDKEVAFKRELKEELGMDAFKKGRLIDAYSWYAGDRKVPYCGIAFVIESEFDKIQLSSEHLQYKWVSKDEIDDYTYIWPCAANMLKEGFDQR